VAAGRTANESASLKVLVSWEGKGQGGAWQVGGGGSRQVVVGRWCQAAGMPAQRRSRRACNEAQPERHVLKDTGGTA